MEVRVTFRNIAPSEGLRRHAERKLRRLERLLRGPAEAHVILSVVKHRHIAEIQLVAGRVKTAVEEVTDDIYSAVDLALDKLRRQIHRQAERRRVRKGAAPSIRRAAAERPAPGLPAPRARRVAVRPMSVAEALRLFERGDRAFLLFRNLETDAVNILYRRKDGGVALGVPEGA